jgi:hypothetical protein
MSNLVFAKDCQTLTELIEWAKGHIPNALIVETEGEIIIQTGLATSTGGYLHPVEEW